MNSSFRAFLSAACGALVGSMIGLEFGQFMMFMGMLMGGLIGYIAYAPQGAWRALRKACKEVLSREGMMHAGVFLLAILLVVLLITLFCLYIAGFMFPFILLESLVREREIAWFASRPGSAGFWGFLVLPWAVYIFFSGYIMWESKAIAPTLHYPCKIGRRIIESSFITDSSPLFRVLVALLILNPVGIAVIVVPGLFALVTIAWLALACVSLIQLLSALIKVLPRAIVLMHEEARLVAGAAAALGAAVGFFAGSALVGGLVGGILGLADVAFLRKRVLAWGAAQRTTAA